MLSSPAERSYIYDSLNQADPIRLDGRKPLQFRPLEATTDFLPSSNGSARIRLADGSECIVSIKSKVILISKEPNLIEWDIEVSGFRDDSNFVSNVKFSLVDLFIKNFPSSKLHLTAKYSYKLYIDCIIVSHSSYPLTLATMAAYLALKTTRLPLLISNHDDAEVEEQPTFSDDWEKAQYLADYLKVDDFSPPLFISVGIVGKNIFVDPSEVEEQVLENGFLIGYSSNATLAPILNMNLATNSINPNFKGFDPDVLVSTVEILKGHLPSISEALDVLEKEERNARIHSIF